MLELQLPARLDPSLKLDTWPALSGVPVRFRGTGRGVSRYNSYDRTSTAVDEEGSHLLGAKMRRTLVILLSFLGLQPFLAAQSVKDFERQAARLVEVNQPLEAVKLLRQGVQLHPAEPSLLVTLGGLLTYLGQTEEGDRFLERALTIDPHNLPALRKRAEANMRRGDLDSAIALFKTALWHGEDAESHERLAFALFLQGKQTEALEHQRKAVSINPFKAGYRRFYAMLLNVERHPEEAYQQLLMAFRLDPSDAPTLDRLSRFARRRGSLSQALEFAELAVEQDPENPLYQKELAECYRLAGATDESRAASERSEALDQLYDTYSAALRLRREGKLEEAASLLKKALADSPPFPTGLLFLADLQRRLGRKEEALELYLQVLKIDPGQVAAREEGAWLEAGEGSLQEALDLLRNSPQPSVNQSLLEGYQAMIRQDWDEALEKLQPVLADYPLNPGLLEIVGSCLSASGRSEEAMQLLEKASVMQPDDPAIAADMRRIRFDRAKALQDRQEWADALRLYQGLQREDPGEADYFLNAGYCRQRMGEREGAVEDYRRGLKIDPNQHWALLNLASSLYQLSRFEEALAAWRSLAASHAGGADVDFQQGLCLSHLGRDAEAEVAFEKAIKAGNQSPELIFNLGVTRLRLMKVEDAWALIRHSAAAGYPPAREMLRRAGLDRP